MTPSQARWIAKWLANNTIKYEYRKSIFYSFTIKDCCAHGFAAQNVMRNTLNNNFKCKTIKNASKNVNYFTFCFAHSINDRIYVRDYRQSCDELYFEISSRCKERNSFTANNYSYCEKPEMFKIISLFQFQSELHMNILNNEQSVIQINHFWLKSDCIVGCWTI